MDGQPRLFVKRIIFVKQIIGLGAESPGLGPRETYFVARSKPACLGLAPDFRRRTANPSAARPASVA